MTKEKLKENTNDLISNSNSVLSPEAVNGDYHAEENGSPTVSNTDLNSLTVEEIDSAKGPDKTQRKGLESEASKLEPEDSPNEDGLKMTHKRLKTKKAFHHSKPDQNKIEDDSIASNVSKAKKQESSKKHHPSNIRNGPKKVGRKFGKGKQKHVILASQDYGEAADPSQAKKIRTDKDVRTRLKLPNAFETKDIPSPPSSSVDYDESESTTPPSSSADYDETESANKTSSKVENSTVPINNTKIEPINNTKIEPINNTKIEPVKNATKEAKNDKGSSAKIVLK